MEIVNTVSVQNRAFPSGLMGQEQKRPKKYWEDKSIRWKLQETKQNNESIPGKYLKYNLNRCQNS